MLPTECIHLSLSLLNNNSLSVQDVKESEWERSGRWIFAPFFQISTFHWLLRSVLKKVEGEFYDAANFRLVDSHFFVPCCCMLLPMLLVSYRTSWWWCCSLRRRSTLFYSLLERILQSCWFSESNAPFCVLMIRIELLRIQEMLRIWGQVSWKEFFA